MKNIDDPHTNPTFDYSVQRNVLHEKPNTLLKPDSPLFVTARNERFTYNGLTSLIRFRSEQAGIARPGLHDFRRAGALEMLRNGADLSQISKYLGHSGIDVTMRYLAINADDLREMHRKASPVDHL